MGFVCWFLVCPAATQLAFQLQQARIQVVRSNKVVRKIPTESNGTPTMDLEHFNVVSKWCMCVLVVTVYSKIRMIIIFVVIITI